MSFELAILDQEGKPFQRVLIGLKAHYQLMQMATKLNLPFLNRLSDYYADVDFSFEELESIEKELITLQNVSTTEKGLLSIKIFELLNLISEAKKRHTGISGISD